MSLTLVPIESAYATSY